MFSSYYTREKSVNVYRFPLAAWNKTKTSNLGQAGRYSVAYRVILNSPRLLKVNKPSCFQNSLPSVLCMLHPHKNGSTAAIGQSPGGESLFSYDGSLSLVFCLAFTLIVLNSKIIFSSISYFPILSCESDWRLTQGPSTKGTRKTALISAHCMCSLNMSTWGEFPGCPAGRTFLVVGLGSIPAQGTKIPQTLQHAPPKKGGGFIPDKWKVLRRATELALLSYGVGEDSWESFGLHGQPTSTS